MLVDRSDMALVHWAREIMQKHDLIDQGWTFVINGRLARALGRCNYTKRRIEMARDHAQSDSYENILDTLMHEIAHALCPGDGHGKQWQSMALRLGARPTTHKSRDHEANAKDVEMYVILRTMPDGTIRYHETTTKHFYTKCMKGNADIKNFYVKGQPHTKGSLMITAMPSSQVALLQAEQDANN